MLPWDAFLDRYRPMARAIAETLTGRHSDAEDVVQEAVLALMAALREDDGRFEDTTHARNYFLRTVRNVALRTRERDRPTLSLEGEPVAPDRAGQGAAALERRRQQLGRLLRGLERSERELIARRFLRRETLAQVAAATGLSISAVHAREKALLARMRRTLREDELDEA